MTTRSALSIAPSLLRLTAVGFFLFVPASLSHAQISDIMERRDVMILRAPGSQIGVSTRDCTPSEARDSAGLLSGWLFQLTCVVVEQVRVDSPASRAGLMKGDVVTVFDGLRVLGANQFSKLVGETPPGWTVKITIVRDGKARDVSITPTL